MAFVLFFSLWLRASDNFETSADQFNARPESECSTTHPEMTAWYFSSDIGLAPLDQEIGEVRDQGNLGWCFAYATSDLLSEFLGRQVSATQLGVLYYSSDLLGELENLIGYHEGGDVVGLLQAVAKKNLCPVEGYPLVGTYQSLKKIRCSEPVIENKRYKIHHHMTWPGTGFVLFPPLDQVLERKQLVTIQYKAEKAYHIPYDDFWNKLFVNGILGSDHASNVVGRHWNPATNQCEYLIRNTWGTGCISANCKRGYYSLPEKLLSQSLFDISYIVNQAP